MELSKTQQNIVTAKESKIVVNACAGSGKTAVLTERVRYLLDNGANPKQMVVITFTNNAADEMRTRLNLDKKDVFIGTIHSYANYLLLSRGIDTSKCIKNDDFDEMFALINFHKECIRPVEWLLLDEAQDCNGGQLQFLFDYLKPQNYFVVGDYHQSIYGWSGSRPDLFLQLSELPEVKIYDLVENYRNSRTILGFAKWILNRKANEVSDEYYYSDKSVAKYDFEGEKQEMVYDPDKIADLIKSKDNFGDWFILTRDNKQLDEVLRLMELRDIPCDTFRQSELNHNQLRNRMNANTVKVLTIHSSKGLEAKNVIAMGMKYYSEEECRVAYVAATRAKDLLVILKGTQPRKRKNTTKMVNWE